MRYCSGSSFKVDASRVSNTQSNQRLTRKWLDRRFKRTTRLKAKSSKDKYILKVTALGCLVKYTYKLVISLANSLSTTRHARDARYFVLSFVSRAVCCCCCCCSFAFLVEIYRAIGYFSCLNFPPVAGSWREQRRCSWCCQFVVAAENRGKFKLTLPLFSCNTLASAIPTMRPDSATQHNAPRNTFKRACPLFFLFFSSVLFSREKSLKKKRFELKD